MRKCLLGVLLVAVISLVAVAAGTLDVYFINVGHGDAILIDCGDWEALLDAGPGSREANLELLSVLSEHVHDGIIELAILSHSHADHYNGFQIVFNQYEVWEFWRSFDTDPDPDPDPDCDEYRCFLAALAGEGLVPKHLERGDRVVMGQIEWVVLGPGDLRTGRNNDNENSLVFLLTYGDVRFLFVGDIESDGEAALLDIEIPEGPLVLKAAHHGSDTATSTEFLAWADPELAVISCDSDDLDDRVASELDSRFVPHLRTSSSGTIHVSTDGESVWVTTDTLPKQIVDYSEE